MCPVFVGTHGTVLGKNFRLGWLATYLHSLLAIPTACMIAKKPGIVLAPKVNTFKLGGGRIEPWLLSCSVQCSLVQKERLNVLSKDFALGKWERDMEKQRKSPRGGRQGSMGCVEGQGKGHGEWC